MAQNSEQPIKRRGPGRPFVKGDPRINRGGVPVEAREFNVRFRHDMAGELFSLSEDGEKTYFQQGIEKVTKAFASGTPWAVDFVFDRFIGKPKVSLGTDDGLLGAVEIIRLGGAKNDAEHDQNGG